MITYQQESIVTCKSDMSDLLQKHWEEVALNKDLIKLNPDWEAYADLENSGMLKIFTARDDKKLIGYFVVLVRSHLHYKDHLFAYNDVIYLDKDYRGKSLGSVLIGFAEDCLKSDNVTALAVNTKIHKPFDNLLLALNYQHIENIYLKVL